MGFVDCFESEYGADKSNRLEPVMSGKAIGSAVLKVIKSLKLNPHFCIGIGTDGCQVMVSKQVGAIQEIKKETMVAERCMCFNHALNLSISKSSQVKSVRNLVATVREIGMFFSGSAKRHHVLQTVLKQELKSLCETRWVERHESLIQFKSEFLKIVESLDLISNWNDTISSSKAEAFKLNITNCEFVATLCCLTDVLSVTKPLSILFQKKNLDKDEAIKILDATLKSLQNKRKNSENAFQDLLKDINKLLGELNVNLAIPRINKRMINRENHNIDNPESYYRITSYNQILDEIITDLNERFNEETLNIYDLNIFLPNCLIKCDDQTIKLKVSNVVSKYFKLFGQEKLQLLDTVLGEVSIWKQYWLQTRENVPENVITASKQCDEIFGFVKTFLQILGTLPVSNASSERSFSCLRRLKTYLRNNMTEKRLTGLALLHINRHLVVDVNNIINRFALRSNRKLDFVI